MRLIAAFAVAFLGLYLLPMAWRFTSIGSLQTSPVLGMKMSYLHFSIFLMLALLTFFAVLRIVAMLAGTTDGRSAVLSRDGEG